MGERPTPQVEPAEPPPGGVDAVEDREYETDPVVPDAVLIGNTATRQAPAEVTEPEDTQTGATSDGATDPQQESPA